MVTNCYRKTTYTPRRLRIKQLYNGNEKRSSKQCKGSLTTDTETARVIRSSSHSHDGSKVTVAAAKVRATLEDKASISRGTPAQLLADHTASVPVEVRAAIRQRDSVKRSVRREKAKAFPANPRSHSDLDEWTLTNDEKPFPIHDSGADSPERMLLFASEVGLTQLAQADTWHMDGTFDSAPTLF